MCDMSHSSVRRDQSTYKQVQREALIQNQISFIDLFSYIWISLRIYRSLLRIDLPFFYGFAT